MTYDSSEALSRRVFQQADDRWQEELVRVYGAKAGDARYDRRGRATPELAALADVRDEAMRHWHAASDSRRDKLLNSWLDPDTAVAVLARRYP